jgi:ribonuclease-3
VAEALALADMLRAAGLPSAEGGIAPEALVASERALASVCEALIGACYLHHGFEVTAEAIREAFAEQIELASETMLDFKSALQERLARQGARVVYEVVHESGPPHDRSFEVAAVRDGERIGTGTGRSKKAAEQAAAAAALERRER